MAKFLIVSFKDTLTHSFGALQVARGVGPEDKDDMKEAYDRLSVGGRVPLENDGLEVFVLGEFDDNKGKITVYDDAEYITTLHAKQEAKR